MSKDDSAKDAVNNLSGLKKFIVPVLVLLVVCALVYVFRPWFQPIYYFFVFKAPGVTLYTVIGIIILGIATYLNIRNPDSLAPKAMFGIGVFSILVVALIVAPMFSGMYAKEDLAAETNVETVVLNDTENAAEIMTDNARITTLRGAQTQADTSFNKPTHRLTEGDLVIHDGTFSTSHAVIPEGMYKSLVRSQEGALFVPINSPRPTVVSVEQEFRCGRGMRVFDDVKFVAQKSHMNSELTRPSTVMAPDGVLYNTFSLKQHDVRFGYSNGFPTLYSVPEYAGVVLSNPDCEQTTLTPQEAVSDQRVSDQQFYPYDLMRTRTLATNYQYGVLNTFTDQEGMKELPNLRSIDNEAPFTLRTEDGMKQVLTMEAIGEGTGVFEVYVGDAQTGELTKYTFSETKKGPQFAVETTIASDPEQFNELTVSEVYPVFREGELWYQSNAVRQGTGVYSYTTFYNPQTEELLKAYTDDQIAAFYAGSDESHDRPENVVDVPGNESSQPRVVTAPSMWANVTDENGDVVYSVPINQNETVVVEDTD